MKSSDFWLMHGSVKAYHPEDFEFLEENERKKLASGVERFQEVSVKARSGGKVTENELKRAKSAFRGILEVMRPDKYDDVDAFVIGKKIESRLRAELPSWVREMVFETGSDASGTPALWVWVEVEDEAVREKSFYDKFWIVDEALSRTASQVCPERWTYVGLRTASEQRPHAERRSRARSNKK